MTPIAKYTLAGIIYASYSISDSISPCNGQSSELLANPARTGFSLT
jgi:hypothetical protein